MVKKKIKQTGNILSNSIIFFILIGTAFTISYIFGLFFVLAYLTILYNGDVKKKPWKMILVFIGALIVRFSLERFFVTVPNYEISLDFIVSLIMIVFIFLIGWKLKRR